MITEDEFAIWRADPVTQGVLDALGAMAEAQKQAWLAASWDSGAPDPMLLTELRTRADAYGAMAEASYGDFFEVSE